MQMFSFFRLRQAMQFGNKLIFDCSYDQHMSIHERRETGKQLMRSFSANHKHKDPFDLHFCSVNFNGHTMQQLQRFFPNLQDTSFPLNLHEGSLLDVFPKKQLIYLTPHCKTILTEYNPNSIYIIGALVPKTGQSAVSLAKCKELGIKMAKLPLGKYLKFGSCGNTLTLNQVTEIMLDLKDGKNWDVALRHVPRRKLAVNENMSATKFSNTFKRVTRTATENDEFENDFIEDKTTSTASKFMKMVDLEDDKNTAGSQKFNKFNQNFRTENDEFENDSVEDKTTSTASKFMKKFKPVK